MNKLFLSMMAAAAVFGSCSDDDGKNNSGQVTDKDLITPELARMAVSSTTSFIGALTVMPCRDNSSIYFGNYVGNFGLSPANAHYIIVDGSVAKSPIPVKLPIGDYNLLYWGVPKNGQVDSTYSDVAIREPSLVIGSNMNQQYYKLFRDNQRDTLYEPVYDFVYAVQPIRIGTDKMEATLKRVVAGLKVILTNQGGMIMNSSIASARIHIGSIASQLNFYTSEPSDFTKTVAFPLAMSADSLSLSSESTVMVFPSGDSPLLSILLTLKNGQVKMYSKPLSGPLVAGGRLTLNITLGKLFVEEGSSDGFEVENWTESSETIDFP